jgi:DNA-binding NarL/FixJ family response regulator
MYRVLLVDDHPVVLAGLAALLAARPELQVVGAAPDRATALRLAAETRPHGVVLDLRLDGWFAADTAGALKAAAPGAVVLLHTATEDREPIRAALRAGADAVVFKDGHELVPALLALLRGERPSTPPLSGRVDSPLPEPLSPREYELLSAFAGGRSTDEAAAEMGLAVSTVRSYTKSLFTKLGVHSRLEAVAAARRLSLV